MAILIKNPETERKARELATLKGQTITSAIDEALEHELAQARPKRRNRTIEEMNAATEKLWERAGVRPPFPPVSKEEWDEINEIPGLAEDWD